MASPRGKYDEESKYKTTTQTDYPVLGIPVNCRNPERASAILEAMAQESWKNVTPAYFETTLKVKYASDDMVKMFDLILENTDFDFAAVNVGILGAIDNVKGQINQNHPNWASFVEGILPGLEAKLEAMLSSYRGE